MLESRLLMTEQERKLISRRNFLKGVAGAAFWAMLPKEVVAEKLEGEPSPILIPGEDPWSSGISAWEGVNGGSDSYRNITAARSAIDTAAGFLNMVSPSGFSELSGLITGFGEFLRITNKNSPFYSKLTPTFQAAAGFVFLPEAYIEPYQRQMIEQLKAGTFPEGWRRIIFFNVPPVIPVDGRGRVTNIKDPLSWWGVIRHEIEHHLKDILRPTLNMQFGENRWSAEEIFAWNAQYDFFVRNCHPGDPLNYYNDPAYKFLRFPYWPEIVGQAGAEFNRLTATQKKLFLNNYSGLLHPDIRNHLQGLAA